LFLQLLVKINKEETLQYLLTLIDQLLTDFPRSVSLFLKLSTRNSTFPFEPLLRLLNRSNLDWYTNSKASSVTATLMSEATDISEENVKFMCNWLREQLRKSEERDVCNGIAALQKVAKKDSFRTAFASSSDDGLNLLGHLLENKSKNFQILYDALYCLWLLSYNKSVAQLVNSTKIVQWLVNILRKGVTKEKVVRLTLATLANLLNVSTNNEQMLDCGLLRPLETLSRKTWADEDVVQDIALLNDTLQKNIAELSSFEVYKKEVISGNLEWTPVHRSEKFWKENAVHFDEDNYKTLSILKELLNSTTDPLVLAVACFDIGEFARFHPRGKNIVQQLGLKLPLMKLMEDKEPEVKKHALLAVQKIMVTNWEYLSH